MDDNTEVRLTAEQEAWRREIEAIRVDALVHFARASGILPDDGFKAVVISGLRKPPMNKWGEIDLAALKRRFALALPKKKPPMLMAMIAPWVDAITLLRQVSKRAESAVARDERTNPRPPGWGTDDYNAAFDYFLSKLYEAYAELLSVPDGKTQSGAPGRRRDSWNQKAIDRLLDGEDDKAVRADWCNDYASGTGQHPSQTEDGEEKTWRKRVWEPYLREKGAKGAK